ncbi:glycoside hydrolase family 43 protein [Amphibacillus cookii]|uniref:glycoside hydrolase family 43 protein n=1 Tax=Amphibacillus cookii TaxID=767787 RepID=UPI00195B66F8|nr:glycoside hydrolase family 43 protein [Amphibacillus cookii]MBM7542639.1 arabinoxylan arabinofuranohydrolase [Amphibacillus cookii]
MKNAKVTLFLVSLLIILIFGGKVGRDQMVNADSGNENAVDNNSEVIASKDKAELTARPAIGKQPPNGNPLLAHQFGADPYALVFDDRVYIYNTHDEFEYDANGEIIENSYANINRLSMISSDDLVNWTDHGVVYAAGREGAAKWASQSWAPAAAHKVIDGEDKFFLYFANNASGIGVLTSDSPTGPWEDPINKPLISWSTPGVAGVTWLFDPAVLVDDDGKAYLYFGGGVPAGEHAMPNTARVIELGEDMTSTVGSAVPIPAPFMFESSGINKRDGVYYYSYCTNFYSGERPPGSPGGGEIAYMTSDHPMGPWEYQGTILQNPWHFFGVGGNNHQDLFLFHDQWYIAYHAQTLSDAMGVAKGYRSTHINKVFFNADGSIEEIHADLRGVEPVKKLNPYDNIQAETMAWNAGIDVDVFETTKEGKGLALTKIEAGSWTAVSSVDFGQGATKFSAVVSSGATGGTIEVRLDNPEGMLIGEVEVPNTGGWEQWQTVSTTVSGVAGVRDVYFVFTGSQSGKHLFNFDYWRFHQ